MSWNGEVVGTILIVSLVVLVGVAVKMFDLKRKREDEAIQLQAQISDALMRDPRLGSLPIMATARVPSFSRGPAVVQLSGQVPTAEPREIALRIAQQEAARIRPDVEIESRIGVVDPSLARVA